MIAKVLIVLAVAAAANAGGLLGVGAPLVGAGHLGLVSAQSTAINHVAPAAPLAYGLGAGRLAYGLGGPLALGHGLGAANLAYGAGVLGHGNLRADGVVGSGILASNYGSAIAHNAVVGHGAGLYGGAIGLGHGAGLYGGAIGLGHGAGLYGGVLGLGHGAGLAKAIL